MLIGVSEFFSKIPIGIGASKRDEGIDLNLSVFECFMMDGCLFSVCFLLTARRINDFKC
jgi:hypothetical protein